ncbi:menaquinol-cytochrome c reductase cytochrome b/c subunit [Alicyclobacillus contaminans]|uniref:menaquinol-cytochrome c reductase cytochrome b/c subunit n=1 Tax=Alicyclobacillus contaminans TaxID=392016 RepID=UPI0004039149|nr:menaquinol-cytochrome c reductase cytochrome b/c subunit [Alicyclobacillus contaminans]GMA48704.1 menaquinol-cytochrome c reductase cytochrome b/c subunit [Alicyclobacillus contaminans]
MAGGERIPGTPRYRHHLETNPGTEPFFPNFLLKEWIVGSVFLLAFMLWVVFNPVDLGDRANPDDTSFIPVPDWYFLFLYQILKYYPGSDIVVGTVLVPMVASLLLVFAPWLDTSKARHPFQRPLATSAMMLTTLLTIWLTNEAAVQHKAELDAASGKASAGLPVLPKIPASQIHLVNTNMPGYKLFEQTCANCHGKSGEGGLGPPIYAIGKYWNASQLKSFVNNPSGMMPKNGTLSSDTEVQQVVDWLSQQKG